MSDATGSNPATQARNGCAMPQCRLRRKEGMSDATIDHVVPFAEGGNGVLRG